MQFNSALLSQMGEATRLLMKDGPAAATARIQAALAGQLVDSPVTDATPTMKDINPPPSTAVPPRAGARFIDASFTNHAGTRKYKLYVPSTYQGAAMPLLVMLHGCTQNPADFAAGTRMNEVAEEQGFLVLYPAQPRSANQSGCWNWFSTADQQRDKGEPAILAGMVGAIQRDFRVDGARIFVAGLSAGGAMAATLGTLYPELFAAVGVHSGLPHACASDMPSAFQAMKTGRTGPAAARLAVPLIVFHGDRDKTVHPRNGSHLVADAVASASAKPERIEDKGKARGGRKYTRIRYQRADGATMVEEWVVHGAGHAWAGGSKAGSHTDGTGPDASREMVRFFRTVTGLV